MKLKCELLNNGRLKKKGKNREGKLEPFSSVDNTELNVWEEEKKMVEN